MSEKSLRPSGAEIQKSLIRAWGQFRKYAPQGLEYGYKLRPSVNLVKKDLTNNPVWSKIVASEMHTQLHAATRVLVFHVNWKITKLFPIQELLDPGFYIQMLH